MKRETISVSGMSCNGCERNVESTLENIEGVSRVEADHVEVVVEDDVADEDAHAAIEGAGYDVAV